VGRVQHRAQLAEAISISAGGDCSGPVKDDVGNYSSIIISLTHGHHAASKPYKVMKQTALEAPLDAFKD
jgi:hypothetical protein